MSNIYSIGPAPVTFTYLDSAAFQQLSQAEKDSLTQSLSSSQLNSLFNFDAPNLAPPSVPLSSVFQIISEATLLFGQQLEAAALVDQKTRRPPNQSAALQAAIVGNTFTQRAQAVTNAQGQAQNAVDQLQQNLAQYQTETEEEEAEIEAINEGNAEENTKIQQQITDYNNFIAVVKQLGGVKNSDGTYTIPSGNKDSIKAYNDAATAYYNDITDFNNYVDSRKQDINHYNASVDDYNRIKAQNDGDIESFINQYGLQSYLNQNNIPSMSQPSATKRDTSQMTDNGYPTQTISTFPATVQVAPPPTWVNTEQSGVPQISSISYTPLSDQQLQIIRTGVYNSIYNQGVSAFDALTIAQVAYWAFLNMLNLFNPVQDDIPDPLLNNKKLAQQILPDANDIPTQPVQTNDKTGGGELAVQVIGLGSPHLQGILSQGLLFQTVNNVNLNVTKEQLSDFSNEVSLLTAGLLGTNSLQSLLPGLGLLSNYLASLPSNSPAYSILFSISFANRIQELIQQGIPSDALSTLISESSSLANLSDTDKASLTNQLTPILNLSLALIAEKLLEANVGVPGLTAQLLPSILPTETFSPEQINTIINTGIQEQASTQAALSNQIVTTFVNQGYTQDEAQFLAQVGTELAAQGLLSPQLTSVSADNVQQPLLTNSVAANLILNSGYSLNEANQIAEQVVNAILQEGTLPINQFYAALETELRAAGVGKEANEIALNTIALPIPESTISLPTEVTQNPALTSVESLSQSQLIFLLERKFLEILSPQIDSTLAKQITSQAIKTIFGQDPSSADLADVVSPDSLVNVIRNQVSQITAQNNAQYADALSDSFKQSIKEDVNLDAFLTKLMDPANLLIYSVSAGLMYGGHEPSNWKKSIDIQV